MSTEKIALVSVVIDNKVLMVNHSKIGYSWDLPGIHINNGEKMITAAAEYFHKRTGYKVKIIGIGKIYNCLDKKRKESLIFNLVGKLEGGKISANKHHARWISIHDIERMTDVKFKNGAITKKIIKDDAELKPTPVSLIEDLQLTNKIKYDKDNNMIAFFKQKSFSEKLFIGASLSAFVVLSLFTAIIGGKLNGVFDQSTSASGNDKYYINKNYQDGDNLITKVPQLRDMIAGPIISHVDPSFGADNSNPTIVEFSDFECAFCHEQEQVIREAVNKHKLRLIWKDAPSSKPGSISYQAAIAARCADRQGKFWEYHDGLFADKTRLNNDGFKQLAKDLNLDRGDFDKCLDGMETKSLVDDNIKEADALGITGVPFVYINNQEAMGQIDATELDEMIAAQKK